MGQDIDWAGVPFFAVFHHDGHFFRAPGLYGFVRNLCGVRTLLFVDHTDNIAVATEGHRLWGEARIDRLVLRAHIIKRCEPLLNVLEEHALPYADERSAEAHRSAGHSCRHRTSFRTAYYMLAGPAYWRSTDDAGITKLLFFLVGATGFEPATP
jgi:hypothetical protein